MAGWALAGWVVVDLVAETPKHVLLSPHCTHNRFFVLPWLASKARTAKDDIDGCVEGSYLSVAVAGFQT